ncbi:TRAP transporter large permease [Desulfopila sp. IMCC35006]|uniref:TRAP transporter large permease n=1 Tax=Desulfopila sp. IMCC35006 TaxID=2569542 RepID=UPI0010ADA52F|nr:TRAP transporter large permease [Desulfopila sp. IMCC35006]TKB28231.1 TRAP transporter large permease [Desulfopila sp. IMCC35006]
MSVVVLFFLLFLLIALGMPIALSIGIPAIGLILTPGVFPATVPFAALGQTIIQLLFAGVDSFDLLAVPLFMLAGAIMERGGISRQIIDFSDSLVGWMPGGLACASIVASMFFAGISGSAAADTAAIGAVVIPAMVRQGYPPAFAAAVVAAGGALGVIIPPSIPMVIFGFLTNVSIAKLFMGGMIVGIFLGLVLMLIAAGISWRMGYGSRRSFSLARVGQAFRRAFWALWAPVIVLGGILTGIVTVTEAAALAVFYALFVSLAINRELQWADLPGQILRSQITAATILLIIAMAKVFTWLVAMKQTSQLLGAVMMNLGLPPWGLLLLVMAGLMVIGCVMETTAALILLVPVLIALTPQLGVDPTQFGVLIVTNLAIGMLTPPIGICLFVSCGISGATLSQTSKAALPFVLAAFFVLVLTSLWPPLTLWLPSIVYP